MTIDDTTSSSQDSCEDTNRKRKRTRITNKRKKWKNVSFLMIFPEKIHLIYGVVPYFFPKI